MGRGRRVPLAGAPRSPSPHRTRTAGYPNQRAHRCAHQEHARTLTHSTDRNDAPGLAYLARIGFFKPVHMKSLSAHALRSLIIARRKTGGPASDLGESDPRFGGRVREHNPSIPVARSAQTPVIPLRHVEGIKSTDFVEKVACCADSLLIQFSRRIGGSRHDGRAAGDAGGAVLRLQP